MSGTTVQATKVFIAPATTPREPEGAFGTVTAVGGVSTAGTCGTGTSGDFTLNGFKSTTTFTVQVNALTTYVDPGVSTPSFANVFVGGLVGALGNVSGSTVAATKVFIAPQPTPATSARGRRNRDGRRRRVHRRHVRVGDDRRLHTQYLEAHHHRHRAGGRFDHLRRPRCDRALLANVCVGGLVGAIGSVSGSTVAATKVFIAPPSVPSFQGHKTSTHRGGPRNRR